MGLLATLDEVKALLDKDDSVHEPLLKMITSGVSARMERYMGRSFEVLTYTSELVESPGYPAVVLDNGPVTNVITVIENATTLLDADFQLDGEKMLVRLVSSKPANWATGHVHITYEAGYEEVPADLAWACVMQTSREYSFTVPGGATLGISRNSPTQTSGESTSYEMKPWLPQVEATMKQYRVMI